MLHYTGFISAGVGMLFIQRKASQYSPDKSSRILTNISHWLWEQWGEGWREQERTRYMVKDVGGDETKTAG